MVSPAEVWLLLDGTRSIDEIVRELAMRSSSSSDAIEREVRLVIAQLENLSLVTRNSQEDIE